MKSLLAPLSILCLVGSLASAGGPSAMGSGAAGRAGPAYGVLFRPIAPQRARQIQERIQTELTRPAPDPRLVDSALWKKMHALADAGDDLTMLLAPVEHGYKGLAQDDVIGAVQAAVKVLRAQGNVSIGRLEKAVERSDYGMLLKLEAQFAELAGGYASFLDVADVERYAAARDEAGKRGADIAAKREGAVQGARTLAGELTESAMDAAPEAELRDAAQLRRMLVAMRGDWQVDPEELNAGYERFARKAFAVAKGYGEEGWRALMEDLANNYRYQAERRGSRSPAALERLRENFAHLYLMIRSIGIETKDARVRAEAISHLSRLASELRRWEHLWSQEEARDLGAKLARAVEDVRHYPGLLKPASTAKPAASEPAAWPDIPPVDASGRRPGKVAHSWEDIAAPAKSADSSEQRILGGIIAAVSGLIGLVLSLILLQPLGVAVSMATFGALIAGWRDTSALPGAEKAWNDATAIHLLGVVGFSAAMVAFGLLGGRPHFLHYAAAVFAPLAGLISRRLFRKAIQNKSAAGLGSEGLYAMGWLAFAMVALAVLVVPLILAPL